MLRGEALPHALSAEVPGVWIRGSESVMSALLFVQTSIYARFLDVDYWVETRLKKERLLERNDALGFKREGTEGKRKRRFVRRARFDRCLYAVAHTKSFGHCSSSSYPFRDTHRLDPPDVIFVTVKSTGIAACVPEIAPILGPNTLVIFVQVEKGTSCFLFFFKASNV